MTRKEKKEELIGLFAVGAIYIGDLIDECIEYGQQHPQWISVKDELPKIKHSVDNVKYSDTIIVTNGKYRTSANWTHNTWTGLYGWLTDGEEELKDVTHWLPMPAPPVVSKSGTACIIGTAEHIKIAMDVMNKKGGEK